MKKFILKSSLFLVFSFLFIFIMSTFLLHTKIFKLNYYPGKEIYTAIDKSKKNNNSKTLLIGDSVANQIFNNEEEFEKLNSLATNQAISLAGQYFLLNDYLKTIKMLKGSFVLCWHNHRLVNTDEVNMLKSLITNFDD